LFHFVHHRKFTSKITDVKHFVEWYFTNIQSLIDEFFDLLVGLVINIVELPSTNHRSYL